MPKASQLGASGAAQVLGRGWCSSAVSCGKGKALQSLPEALADSWRRRLLALESSYLFSQCGQQWGRAAVVPLQAHLGGSREQQLDGKASPRLENALLFPIFMIY